MDRLAKSGQLRRIYEKWDIWNDDQQRLLGREDRGATISPTRLASVDFTYYFPLLLHGAVVTVELTFVSMFVAMLLGLPIALMRLYGPPPLRLAAVVYVEFFRGIPVLLLLFFLYYGLPVIVEHLPVRSRSTCGWGRWRRRSSASA